MFLRIGQCRKPQDQHGDELTEKEIGVTEILENYVNGMGQIIMLILFCIEEIGIISE
jgi:hypothetical protein